MALIDWDEKLSVNVKSIDEQHKKLIGLINLLHDSMKEGKAKDIMNKVLGDLADYTDYHFQTEEKYFQQFNYPEFVKHKKEHDDLRKEVLNLKNKLDKGEGIITIEVMYFLKDWLSKHILGSDKKYSSFFNSKGVI